MLPYLELLYITFLISCSDGLIYTDFSKPIDRVDSFCFFNVLDLSGFDEL